MKLAEYTFGLKSYPHHKKNSFYFHRKVTSIKSTFHIAYQSWIDKANYCNKTYIDQTNFCKSRTLFQLRILLFFSSKDNFIFFFPYLQPEHFSSNFKEKFIKVTILIQTKASTYYLLPFLNPEPYLEVNFFHVFSFKKSSFWIHFDICCFTSCCVCKE